jgi:signal transduction histidine kinase
MSIRLQLTLLVSVLVIISITVLVYLTSAYLDTRMRLREADAALNEFVQAVNTGAAISRLRLLVLYQQSAGTTTPRELDPLILDCENAFETWKASSSLSIQMGIEEEADDLAEIEALLRDFQSELEGLRATLRGEAIANPDLFDQLVDTGVRRVIDDDLREMNAALDGILLSMGTTPWIAWIGPGQLATARATLAEIRAAQMVRDRLQRQSSRIALLLADATPEAERAAVRSTASLDETLRAWRRATDVFTAASGLPAPPHFGKFTAENQVLQSHVNQILDDARSDHLDAARVRAADAWMPTLQRELLPILETSLATEVDELRTMLGNLSSSTGSAGAGGIALICLALLSTLAGAFLTVRTMLRALEQLRVGTEIVGAGNFGHRVNLGTSDELGRLSTQFDAMAERLQEQVRERERLEKELLRSERLATLGQVIATVSHEIRNPLGTIQTALYSLRKRVGDQGDAVTKSLDRADRSIIRCDRIIGELLDYTRTREPIRVETPLDPWLAEVLDDFTLPAGVSVSQELDSRATLWIDRNRIQGCVVNLLSNACQSIVERAGDQDRRELHVASRHREDRLEIQVTDTGPGIAPEVLDKIFEPMYSTRTYGVGLGLPIVLKNMELHGGGVEIISEVGRGTAATLWFPAPDRKETQHEESPHTGS